MDTVRYSTRVGYDMRNWIYADTNKWDSLAYWMPIGRDFQNIVSQNPIPILIENTWQDYFFNTLGVISTIPNMTSPKRFYFGAVVGHGGDISATENTWHQNFYNEWFFYWLFNDTTYEILTRPIYHFASTSFPLVNSMWTFVHDSSSVWPPAGLSDLNLYLNPN